MIALHPVGTILLTLATMLSRALDFVLRGVVDAVFEALPGGW